MFIALLAALAASAEPPSTPGKVVIEVPYIPPLAARQPASTDKMICREWDYPGTRLRTRRVCGTKADWRAYELNVRYDMDRAAQIAAGF